MTRKNPSGLVDFEPEIEARASRILGQTLREKKKKQREQPDSEGTTSITNEESTNSSHHPSETIPTKATPMADQTIRELAAAPIVQQPLCITFPQGETPFELKTGLIHLLPTFLGLPSESPHKHLAEFHLVCSTKEWLFYLLPNSITTWTDLNSKFLDRFFPTAKASEIRRSILGIRQRHEESLYEYWERYKKLYASCPQHGLSE
ncbi:hypothetical protein V6N11_049911 [Hibiscus sabdariffa]|uniref:Retrotransposon gag domain-containing protein n=1 Tax=Hibiscus sabdariffa TaxID=183260 RepID=A0ABR2T8S0_9ROSI